MQVLKVKHQHGPAEYFQLGIIQGHFLAKVNFVHQSYTMYTEDTLHNVATIFFPLLLTMNPFIFPSAKATYNMDTIPWQIGCPFETWEGTTGGLLC